MPTRAIAILVAVVGAALLLSVKAGELRAQSSAALTGVVSSAEEGPMEGVIVSAKAPASTITVSVVSDNRGRYTFPAAKLAAANYNLQVRAVGYDLTAPVHGGGRLGLDGVGGSEAAQSSRHRAATERRRVGREHAGYGRAKEAADQLQRLPFAAAHRHVGLERPRISIDHPADEHVRESEHRRSSAKANGGGRLHQRRYDQAMIRVSGKRQPARALVLDLSAQRTAAPDRCCDARAIYTEYAAAATDDRTARRVRAKR